MFELSWSELLIIAIVAVVRHLLFVSVKSGGDPLIHTVELLGLGGLILLLVGALVLLRAQRAPNGTDGALAPPGPSRSSRSS